MENQDILQKGFYYHIYNRGNNRENLFLEENNYHYFLNLVGKYLLPISEIYCYCLLKNHFHVLLRIKDDLDLPDEKLYLPFSNLFNAYAKAINKKYNSDGSLFKERYKRKRVMDEDYLINTIIYIHLNPVKHGFCDKFENYIFSSFRSIISDKPTELRREEVLELFGGKQNYIDTHFMKKSYDFGFEME